MPDCTVTRLRPRQQPGYTDTSAVNDIHALITCGLAGPDLAADIGVILARTGRPMIRGRHIDATVSESPAGWPVAEVEAEDTTVTVRQDPAGTGLLIQVTTTTPAEHDSLTIALDGRCLHHPHPGGHAA